MRPYYTRGVIEAIAERRPDFVDAVIRSLPPVGDESEAVDMRLWENGSIESAYPLILRRARYDESFVRAIEDTLLDKLCGVKTDQS